MSRELERHLDSLINPDERRISGLIGLSKSKIKVSGRGGFIYVRILDNQNEVIQAFNDKVAPIYNMPVMLEFKENKYRIVGRDETKYADWKSDSAFLPPHGGSHSAMKGAGGGADVVWIDTQQFLPFLVMPYGKNGSRKVMVAQSIFRNLSGTFISAGNTGTADYPTSFPDDRIYILMMRDVDGSLYSLTGSSIPTSVTGTSSVVSYLPIIPDSNLDHPLAAIRINTGTIGWDNIIDLREIFNRSQSNTYNLTVEEIDGFPSVTNVSRIRVSNGTLTNDGGGQVTLSVTGSSSGGPSDFIIIRDEKSSGTDGGTATSGSYQTRDLNTIVHDSGGNCSLPGSNVFRLSAGTYKYHICCPAYAVNQHKIRLYDVTSGVVVTDSEGSVMQAQSSSGGCNCSDSVGIFTITSVNDFRVEHMVATTRATNGFGVAAGFGDKEIYSVVELEKIA